MRMKSSSRANRRRKPTVQVKSPIVGSLKVFKRRQPALRMTRGDRFATIVLGIINARFPQTPFTRDDVLNALSQLRLAGSDARSDAYGINDVATCTRYRKICDAIQSLLSAGKLIRLDGWRLCVPEAQQQIAKELPSHVAYLPTIRRLVQQNFHAAEAIDVMSVVDVWQSDQHLPQNIKRMTARSVFLLLLRDGVLRRGSDNEFIVDVVDNQMAS